MEEWGTGVPYGAFFSSNPKSPAQKDGEEDDEEEEDNEGEEGDEEADEDYEAESMRRERSKKTTILTSATNGETDSDHD